MSNVPDLILNDDNSIPQLGFGVFQIKPEDTTQMVTKALEIGYRHIDTAEMYKNEKEVGKAVHESGIERSEIFITSKLNNSYHKPDDAKRAFQETLEKLQVDAIDLFLIHWPLPTLYNGDFAATWKVLESFKKEGTAKSIGVSNFQITHLEQLAEVCEIVPAVNQVELHPYFTNSAVAEYCKQHQIAIEAWSPIAQGGVLDDVTIIAIAEDIHKSPAQVVLRWHIQHGYIIFPKSVTPARIKENFELFDFELTADQMTQLDDLDKAESGRTGPNPDTFDYISS